MRKHEFEADAYAASQAEPQRLIDALVKLYEENAATLTPDRWYSAYHDSHPPAPVRIAQLAGQRPCPPLARPLSRPLTTAPQPPRTSREKTVARCAHRTRRCSARGRHAARTDHQKLWRYPDGRR